MNTDPRQGGSQAPLGKNFGKIHQKLEIFSADEKPFQDVFDRSLFFLHREEASK